MEKLLYIGKSNKKFTHGKIYKIFYGYCNKPFFILIESNKGKVTYNNYYIEHFENNFKLISKEEEQQLKRKNKLNKINTINKKN